MLNETAPAAVMRRLDLAGLNHRPTLLTTSSDILLDGNRGASWVIVTADDVTVIGGAHSELLATVARTNVESFRASAGVGSGTLQAKVDGVWTDLVRYSNSLADRFQKLGERLENYRESGELRVEAADAVDLLRCQQCNMRLPAIGESCPRCTDKSAVLGRVWALVKPHWRGSATLMALTLAGVALELVPPKLQQYLVDDVLHASDAGNVATGLFSALFAVVAGLAASRAVLSLLAAWKGKLATRLGGGLTHELRSQLVDRLQHLPLAYFDRHQAGSLMSRVAYDTEVLHGLIHQITGGFLLQILQLVGVGAMLLALNAKLALFTLVPVPLVIGGTWYFWRRIYPRYYRYWDASSKQVSALVSMLSGIRVVRGFAQEPRELGRFQKTSETLRSNRLWVEESTANYSALMQLIFSLGGLIVWFVGGRDVIAGQMTLGSLIAFLAYLAMFYAPLGALSQFTTWLTSFLTGARRVMELLDTPITVREPENPRVPERPLGRIAFSNVRFGYDRNQPVLKGVSFDIRPGEMIGIVGRSGSGKTTLVNLLGRFYDVDDGRIEVDGIDVREYPLAELHRRIGIVFQESYLFRGTIWENLAYGRPDATIEHGLAAAKAGGAHDFILRSTLGYETTLGDNGAGLSGGEKQRLSIARALLYDPPILVLDEATSSVDTETERGIQEALERLTRNRTTIAIAHRLSTLRHANRILVFDRGRLAEEGSHAALLAKDGIYAKLVRIQTQLTGAANVDRLVERSEHPDQVEPESNPAGASAIEPADATAEAVVDLANPPAHIVQWLSPGEMRFEEDSARRLCAAFHYGRRFQGIFAVLCFPATRPEEYISVRYWDDDGEEKELGVVRSMKDWPTAMQELLRTALRRRYLLRKIDAIESIDFRHGYLWLKARIDGSGDELCMRWSQNQALDFGPRGKLLLDVDDNRYVVPDVGALPATQEQLFRRYIYW